MSWRADSMLLPSLSSGKFPEQPVFAEFVPSHQSAEAQTVYAIPISLQIEESPFEMPQGLEERRVNFGAHALFIQDLRVILNIAALLLVELLHIIVIVMNE